MILQIPVEKGYRGGLLKVDQRSSKTKQFELEKDSDQLFSLTAFRSNCEHELEPIKSGWRVTLVVNLVWRNALITKIPLPLPELLDLVTEIRKSVDCWFPRPNQAQHNHQPHGDSDARSRLAITGNKIDVAEPVNEPISIECNSNSRCKKITLATKNDSSFLISTYSS